jgi:hypothetical protein
MALSNAPVRGVNTIVGAAAGAVYLLVGLLGFAVSSGYDFAGREGGKLLGIFMVNPLHNVAHLLIGALLVAAATGATRSPRASTRLSAGSMRCSARSACSSSTTTSTSLP